MQTAFFTEPESHKHTLPGHPEHAGRLQAVIELLDAQGILDQVEHIHAQPATEDHLLAVHKQSFLDRLAAAEADGRSTLLDGDTYFMPESYQLAKLAAGGVIGIVDAVLDDTSNINNGIAAVRPPGHHATPTRAMGFCLLNNIAVAAQHACQAHGLERVAIVDYDVHHGNGTQDCLYETPKVLFVSSHQSPLYPGTGMVGETGTGQGQGYTVNIPLPPGCGDDAFRELYSGFVSDVIRRYAPQLILVSVGHDAHWVDPLAQLSLTLEGYAFLARHVIALAGEICDGKIVFVMEGGYDLTALSHGWLNIAHALLGKDDISDPLGTANMQEPLPANLMNRLEKLHSV